MESRIDFKHARKPCKILSTWNNNITLIVPQKKVKVPYLPPLFPHESDYFRHILIYTMAITMKWELY